MNTCIHCDHAQEDHTERGCRQVVGYTASTKIICGCRDFTGRDGHTMGAKLEKLRAELVSKIMQLEIRIAALEKRNDGGPNGQRREDPGNDTPPDFQPPF